MAITSYNQTRIGNITTVTVISDLSGTVYYHWYVEGVYVGFTTSPIYSLHLEDGEQVRIVCLDAAAPLADPMASAPDGFPRRRTLFWVRSVDDAIATYRIEQQREAEGWLSLGVVRDDPRLWAHTFLTPRLDDLTDYQWRIVPVNAAGVDGVPLTFATETVVGRPDAPDWFLTYDPNTQFPTFDLV